MGRRKRSEKIAEGAVKVMPAPLVAPPRVAEKVIACLCPVCGRTIPQDRALKVGYVTVGKVGYFDNIDWDPNKSFGVAFTAAGRGSFREWQHINPEDAPELFEAVKERFLQALKEWVVDKKWITRDELGGLMLDRKTPQNDNIDGGHYASITRTAKAKTP